VRPALHPEALRFAELAHRLTAILMALRPLIAHHFLRHPWVPNAVTVPLWNRLGHLAARFARLAARLAAGRLPPHRIPRATPTARPPEASASRFPSRDRPTGGHCPTRPGWMLAAMGWHVASCRAQLESLLADPAMAELVALAPASAARILRPLCHMLGLPPPCPPPPQTALARAGLSAPPPQALNIAITQHNRHS
jgi:hypothetical protein